ncbi:Predicted N-acetyltransferase YhbS [Alkalibacterium subtropicum]|uniref:Predicted N-acetyltransferase YhbS n=1 Tax=Alkalibacterium subtropicum TaxID=753702 RepID=A0A1I1HKI4_9LACT|nr:N-acetyltransferase [Alkalibacterium subtropicum]SFC24361.1 Predicted N-acetyltransferase YhbS [Alkalibacterium subtropicum]
MIIRAEKSEDYMKIGELHCSAFENSGSQEESVLACLLRQEKAYTPRLSLVTEEKGDIIGHVMVTPYTFTLKNQSFTGGILAPLGVKPGWQKKGVGSQLMTAVHREAEKSGLSFIALLGHDTYYPRFGYETHLFGETSIRISLPLTEKGRGSQLTARKPLTEDTDALQEMWSKTHADVPLAIVPDASIHSWLSTSKDIQSRIYSLDGRIVGYTRIHERTKEITSFAAENESAAKDVLAKVVNDYQLQENVSLPLHPVRMDWFTQETMSPKTKAWPAGMICFLKSDPAFDVYKRGVEESDENIGIIQWPVPFEAI